MSELSGHVMLPTSLTCYQLSFDASLYDPVVCVQSKIHPHTRPRQLELGVLEIGNGTNTISLPVINLSYAALFYRLVVNRMETTFQLI